MKECGSVGRSGLCAAASTGVTCRWAAAAAAAWPALAAAPPHPPRPRCCRRPSAAVEAPVAALPPPPSPPPPPPPLAACEPAVHAVGRQARAQATGCRPFQLHLLVASSANLGAPTPQAACALTSCQHQHPLKTRPAAAKPSPVPRLLGSFPLALGRLLPLTHLSSHRRVQLLGLWSAKREWGGRAAGSLSGRARPARRGLGARRAHRAQGSAFRRRQQHEPWHIRTAATR